MRTAELDNHKTKNSLDTLANTFQKKKDKIDIQSLLVIIIIILVILSFLKMFDVIPTIQTNITQGILWEVNKYYV